MMGRRQKLVCGDEVDMVHYKEYRRGGWKKIKKRLNKRDRKEAKANLMKIIEEKEYE